MEIYVDDREDPRVVREGLKHFPDLIVKRLDVGDVVYKNLAIERKEVHDFVGSVNDNRIFKQVDAMKKNYPYSYVFLEGDMNKIYNDPRYVHFPENRFESNYARITVDYECPMVPVRDNEHFWKKVSYFIKRLDDDKPLKPLEKKVDRKLNPVANAISNSVPGIGPVKAEKISKFFDMRGLCECTLRELQEVPGIGVKQSKAIKEVFK